MTNLDDLPGHLIRRLQQIAVSAFITETSTAGYELTPVQFAVLAMLENHPGIDQATLAGLIAYDRVTIGGVISRLEGRGLIERRISPSDRRARTLKLSDEGQRFLDSVRPSVFKTQKIILKELSAAERETFLVLLRKLTDANNELSRAPLRRAPDDTTRG
ncbi:MarR family transcriptional regulator [Martelella sp. HB161492]|uniref:MarR family winged helix-turn-helix transcriptional regulator n=1 Tax=Martelella sp. HB161492 TaxID=2720726 RepID=UPI001590AA83|nr:MarR family transcriptional regulator [Martelella sp. HB161492]